MNGTDDFIGRLEEYLDDFDGPTPLPDHVRDAIHAELPGTRQVRPGAGPMRLLTMLSNTPIFARWGLAAAAIVVAVALGAVLLTGNQNQNNIGAPTPTPSIAPSAPPAATPEVRTLIGVPPVSCGNEGPNECLPPGTYTLMPANLWPTTVRLAVPEGWWEWSPDSVTQDFEGLLVDDGPTPSGGSGWGIMFMTVGEVSKDPCDPNAGMFAPADVDTPEELAAAMATWPGFEATTPVPTSIDTVDGLLVELTSTRTLAQCPGTFLWKTAAGVGVDAYPMVSSEVLGRPGQFRIIEVAGKLIVIRTTDFPQNSPYELSQGIAADPTRHAADQVELHAILDSIRLGAASQ